MEANMKLIKKMIERSISENVLEDFTDVASDDFILFEDGRTEKLDIDAIYPDGWILFSDFYDYSYDIIDRLDGTDLLDEYKRVNKTEDSDELKDLLQKQQEEIVSSIRNDSRLIGKTTIYTNKVLRYRDGSLVFLAEPDCFNEMLVSKSLSI